MDVIGQVLIGLLTTFIGFVLGLAWQMSRRQITYWRARRFWRPFFSDDMKIVMARFREFDAFEASGLVGVGGMQAAAELVSLLDDLGFRRMGRTIDIVYHDQLPGDLSGVNVVCIGGPDGNQVTRRILEGIDHTIALGDPKRYEISIRDTSTGQTYKPERERGKNVILDYGLLVKAPNPFDPQRTVLVFAGSFGYGTWAGIKLARSPQFLRSPLVSAGAAVECLYKTEVIEEIPQQPNIVLIRPIQARKIFSG
jgi:hypothetical protein